MTDDTNNFAHELIELRGVVQAMKEQGAATRDTVGELAREVRQLGNEIGRVANSERSIELLWQQIEKSGTKQAEVNEKVTERLDGMRLRMGTWVGGLAVATFMLGGVVGLVAYIYNTDRARADREAADIRSELRKHDERMDRLEIHAAGDRDRPYKR